MKPLIVLTGGFILLVLFSMLPGIHLPVRLAGNIAMCLMLCFTAMGHFKFSRGMQAILPPWLGYKKLVVIISGLAEILWGVMLLYAPYRGAAAIMIIVFLLLALPLNIYAARHNVNIERADNSGAGLKYLWFRVPLQLLFIVWLWWFSVL